MMGMEGALSPSEFSATTVTLYAVPLSRERMVQEVAGLSMAQLAFLIPSCAVAVYVSMALPPVSAPNNAVQLTVICWFPATADTPVGVTGTVASTSNIKS